MSKIKKYKKILAGILIFAILFINIGYDCTSIAAYTKDIVVEKQTEKTNEKNVNFDAYFTAENDEKSYSAVCDVSEEFKTIQIALNVKNEGYLKDGTIEFENSSKLIEILLQKNNMEESVVTEVVENKIMLNQINKSSEIVLNIPMKYIQNNKMNLSDLQNTLKVKLNAVYVNEKGDEIQINKDVYLNVEWKDTSNLNIETAVTKYLPFENKILVQTAIKIKRENEVSLPIQSSTLEIDTLNINGIKPETIEVFAKDLTYTDGQDNEKIEFSKDNWEYHDETNKIVVNVENKPLENGEYSNLNGTDEYVVTYIFGEEAYNYIQTVKEIKFILKNKITSRVYTSEINTVEISGEREEEIVLTQKIGEIVVLEVENNTPSISKAYMNANYNRENEKLETELKTTEFVNITGSSSIEEINIKEENYVIINELQEAINTYYKSVEFNKENINNILGEKGKLVIVDEEGKELGTIKKFEITDETEKTYKFELPENINKIVIKIANPESNGNLIINKTKVIKDSGFDKVVLDDIKEIKTLTNLEVKYVDSENIINIDSKEISTILENTSTNAKIDISDKGISTIVKNENVELKIELNDNKLESDLYKNPTFEAVFPSEVTEIEVNRITIANCEELKIASYEVIERDERKVLVIKLEGTQTNYTESINNGTNIIANVNISVDNFTPLQDSKIELIYTNDIATSYAETLDEKGYSKVDIKMKAPVGMVAINGTSGFDEANTNVISINQGKKEGKLEIFAEARVATMNLIVMNNNTNISKDVVILGRIPYSGTKDLETNEDLGSNLNTTLKGAILANENNKLKSTIYYSENIDATKDLLEEDNGWKSEVTDYSKIKSYLIVIEKADMDKGDILKFSYNYEIPANLEHNSSSYGTLGVYYNNYEENITTEEFAKADLVGITTGKGPQLEISLESNLEANDIVREGQKVTLKINVKNTGIEKVENIKITLPVPNYTYLENNVELKEKVLNIEALEKNETKTLEVILKIGSIDTNQITAVATRATLEAKDLAKKIESNEITINLKPAEMVATFSSNASEIVKEKEEFRYYLNMENLKDTSIKNVKATIELDDGLEYVRGKLERIKEAEGKEFVEDDKTYTVVDGNEDREVIEIENSIKLNENNLNVNITEMEKGYLYSVTITVQPKELENDEYTRNISSIAKITADSMETYITEEMKTTVGRPKLEMSISSSRDTSYIKEGEELIYKINVANNSNMEATNITIKDSIPQELRIKEILIKTDEYEINSEPIHEFLLQKTLRANENVEITIKTIAKKLADELTEKEIVNYFTITTENNQTIESEKLQHIIEFNKDYVEDPSDNTEEPSDDNDDNNKQDEEKMKYKIQGIAWLDNNENGQRDADEKLLKNINVVLMNKNSEIIATSLTDDNGEYVFENLENGIYFILAKYNEVEYRLTEYEKAGVSEVKNSDFINSTSGAITKALEIKDISIGNIDLGLILRSKFDLRLDKYVSRVTVQNRGGTTTYDFENSKLSKTDIAAKYLSGSTVLIEYKLVVTNEGDIEGYAKKIVDYMPESMTFSSDLNPEWYSGNNGNIYTTELANTVIAPGESKEITLILSKLMTEENTGIMNNTAEIEESYNIKGIEDIDSTPGNRIQTEDDYSSAKSLITVKTGESFVYISTAVSTVMLIIISIVIINSNVKSKRKGWF